MILYALRQLLIYGSIVFVYARMPVNLDPNNYFHGLDAVFLFLVLAFLISHQLRKQQNRFFDLLALLILTIHTFAFSAYALAVQQPDQFTGISTRVDALYFTIVTMSTVGFGDVHPVGQEAKMLVIAMIIFDLVFIAALGNAMSSSLSQARKKETPKENKTRP